LPICTSVDCSHHSLAHTHLRVLAIHQNLHRVPPRPSRAVRARARREKASPGKRARECNKDDGSQKLSERRPVFFYSHLRGPRFERVEQPPPFHFVLHVHVLPISNHVLLGRSEVELRLRGVRGVSELRGQETPCHSTRQRRGFLALPHEYESPSLA
jgi:hypothetical protein